MFYHPLKIITKKGRRDNVTSRFILFITVVVVKRTKMNDLDKREKKVFLTID